MPQQLHPWGAAEKDILEDWSLGHSASRSEYKIYFEIATMLIKIALSNTPYTKLLNYQEKLTLP